MRWTVCNSCTFERRQKKLKRRVDARSFASWVRLCLIHELLNAPKLIWQGGWHPEFRLMRWTVSNSCTVECRLNKLKLELFLKDEPLLFLGGKCRAFVWTQMIISWVWGVRGGQFCFFYKVWTHRDPLGVWSAPKSICTHRHTPLKLLVRENDEKVNFDHFGTALPISPKYPLRFNFAFKAWIKPRIIDFMALHPS